MPKCQRNPEYYPSLISRENCNKLDIISGNCFVVEQWGPAMVILFLLPLPPMQSVFFCPPPKFSVSPPGCAIDKLWTVGALSAFGRSRFDSVNMADEDKTAAGLAPATEDSVANTGYKSIFDIPDCKVETVVVYLDRAEICRSLKTTIKSGETEILLKKLSSCVDKDSIR